MTKIRCAVVGVGNCFAGLVQGVEFYKQNPSAQVTGVMHPVMGGYTIHDLDFVAAFDVDSKKVGHPLSDAVYSPPNKVKWVEKLSTLKNVIVRQGPRLDGVGSYVNKVVDPVIERPAEELKKEILKELKEKKVEILVSYLPEGVHNT
jgi:myo-inositol-1-phosphate synthase